MPIFGNLFYKPILGCMLMGGIYIYHHTSGSEHVEDI